MSRVARAVALTALTLCCAPAFTGCGVVDRPVSGVPVEQAVYRPLSEDTFAAEMVEATLRYDTYRFELTSDVVSMDMDVRQGPDDQFAMKGTIEESSRTATMVVVDDEVYVRARARRVYFQFPDHLAKQLLADVSMSQPAAMAEDFASGIESVEYGGAYDVFYGTAHRYDLVLTDEFVAEQLGIEPDQVPEFSYRMWLDDTHLPHRLTTTVMGVVADVRLDEWGEPVDIEKPPSRLVEPLPMPTDAT